jgi:hypothetical protein
VNNELELQWQEMVVPSFDNEMAQKILGETEKKKIRVKVRQ